MGNFTILQMFENPRRGRQARNFTTNVPKILVLKSSSEQIFFRKLSLGAPDSLRLYVLILYRFGQVFSRKNIKMSNYKDVSFIRLITVQELNVLFSSREFVVWQLKVHGNRRGQSNESLKTAPFFKGFRNKSRFTKRRKLYRMLPIGEKANRIYGVIQWFKVLLSTSQRHVIIKTQRYKFLNFFTGERVFSPRNLLKL